MNIEAILPRSQFSTALGGPDLAHRPPFRLGQLLIEPAMRRIASDGGEALTIQPLAMRVLLALVDAQGETCSRDDLVHACWDQRIVGDDAVHRAISMLRRSLAQLSAGGVAIETIPKVGYRLRVDPGPSGEDGASVAETAKPQGSVKPWLAAAAIAILASAGLFANTRAGADVTSIAVIAEAGAAGAKSARFADGLTGELARLASAMPSVAFVEPGGEQAGEPLLLRVTLDTDAGLPTARVRLVDRKGGAVVWSREFVAEGGTMAELRERVANGVTGVVQCGLDRSAVFNDPVGLRLYLGACEGLETGDFARARAFAQQITEFRPNAAAGWACLANSSIFAEAKNGQVDKAVLARADGYARKALAVDPNSGLAYVALAMVSGWRGEPVLDILERGIRVDPDFAMLHKHYAWALSHAGMASKAVEPALRAVALHPHDPSHYQTAVAALVDAGRTDEALALSAKMQRMWRYDRGVELQRLGMLVHAPNAEAALAVFEASPLRDKSEAALVYQSLVWRADPDAYDWSQFDRVAERMYDEDARPAWRLSAEAARMGDQTRALEWLARAPPTVYNAWSPMFAPGVTELRRDPRFFAKMASTGMVARWQKSGRWPDFCADPKLRYDCRTAAVRMARTSFGE